MSKTALLAIVVAVTLGTGARHADAQVCGDADDSGAVTVTDGVQVLRAAAGLSSTCVASRCDIDGSGSITVTDGVNVLRKSAGLPITEICVTTSRQVIAAFIGEITKIPVPASTAASAVPALSGTQACDEGFLEFEGSSHPTTTKITYSNCRVGITVLNGSTTTITLDSSTNDRVMIRTILEELEAHYLDRDLTIRQSGTTDLVVDKVNKLQIENGTLTIFHSRSVSGADEYTLTKKDFTTNTETGEVVAGELSSALLAAGLEHLKAVTLGYVTGSVADVDVEFEDGHHEAFKYDLETKELTPADVADADAIDERERRAAVANGSSERTSDFGRYVSR